MIQTLMSVPPRLRDYIHSAAGEKLWAERLRSLSSEPVFIGTDPIGRKLGSGGGTVNLLYDAWRASGAKRRGNPLEWLSDHQTLVLHAAGESRRLPAYAAIGKAFLPMPALDCLHPHRFDQMLADVQVPSYKQVLHEAGGRSSVLVTSGDVWLDFNPLAIPSTSADLAGIGMRVSPEVAQHFGVFFVRRDHHHARTGEQPIAFFRQKPSPSEIYAQLPAYDFYVDTGMWLLSQDAVRFLFARCGWDDSRRAFATADGHAAHLDLYTEIGCAMGTETKPPSLLKKLGWPKLTTAVVPLEEARFYHLGSSRQLFESFEQIQRSDLAPRKSLLSATSTEAFSRQTSLPVWLDGVSPAQPIRLGGNNLVTGLPPGARIDQLTAERCIEVAPVGKVDYVFRPYHLDDTLRGTSGKGALICGIDAATWLKARDLPAAEADVFTLALYPVLPAGEIDQALLEWFFSESPDARISARVATYRKFSAAQIPQEINFTRLFSARRAGYSEALRAEFQSCLDRGETRVFEQDFFALAAFCRSEATELGQWLRAHRQSLLAKITQPVHKSRFLMLLGELASEDERQRLSAEAYSCLQTSILSSNQLAKIRPQLALKDDQIVWGRSPVRLDLAGGWTDTPPYCLEHGGAVLNLAVLLNGQPPIQVFIRPIAEFHFRLRSIDLGSSEEIKTYEALAAFRDPRANFSLPKAALALAGFHPDFLAARAPRSLEAQLKAFGGGLEISLLSAVPKGSGLGTSSILGATLLAALNRACSLGWDEVDLYNRVLGAEQLLTTGGGWQDQAGALFRSIKLVQTPRGLAQTPNVRYLPHHLLEKNYANQTLFLYYTGVTRLAKGILKEIVHDMFLGRTETLHTLALIRANAMQLYHTLQEGEPEALLRCIARSWELNKRLDPGTTTPEIERIIATCGDHLAACKLLGAGGGGYMLLGARTPEEGAKLRRCLEAQPPNRRARFIDFAVAEHALEVTVS